nr:hypothetical protein GCM10020185_50700 [Pseudomonas brassicacearum subsp. brassicacearum]
MAQVSREIQLTLENAKARRHVDEQAIFSAHLALLEDPVLLDAADLSIEQGCAAPHAWSRSIDEQCQVLRQLQSTLLAERANDLHDLRQRVLRVLLGEAWQFDVPAGAIVVAQELTPSDLLQLSAQGVAGVCMAEGGATSHVAILARGKGLPCLVALGEALLAQAPGQSVVLDADGGRLELTPTAERLAQVQQAQTRRTALRAQQQTLAHTPARTVDGVEVEVAANVASSAEASQAFANGADGVGLLRTEFLFVDRHTAPDDEEQRQAYQAVLDAMGDRPVIIRTIDVGGDKQLDYLPLPAEANPVLGLRGIRLAQVRPELLDQQLRALLQTRPLHRCRILLPMVTEVDELLHIRQRLDALGAELGLSERPQLGGDDRSTSRRPAGRATGRARGLPVHWHQRPVPVHPRHGPRPRRPRRPGRCLAPGAVATDRPDLRWRRQAWALGWRMRGLGFRSPGHTGADRPGRTGAVGQPAAGRRNQGPRASPRCRPVPPRQYRFAEPGQCRRRAPGLPSTLAPGLSHVGQQ